MPYVIVAGLGVLTGAIGGFMVGDGAKAVENSVKYAALGVGAFFIAKQMKLIK